MTKPTDPHATTADIQAILKARKDAVTPQSIPAAPVPYKSATVHPFPATPPIIHAQGLAVPAPEPTPAPTAPASPPVSDDDLAVFLSAHLASLKDAAAALAKPPFQFGEVMTLAAAVSGAVHDGLPLVKGTQAAQLVNTITAYLFDKYVAPALPSVVKPFASIIRTFLLASIEPVYRFIIKKVGQK